jgi:glycosyltransferase involved in cell wall biosynthesis
MISVIVNVYNGEKYIKKCLTSIVNQTYKDLEIIVVNDGSTDKTLSICKKIKDKRIKIINQDNIGISLSRNVGIDNAKGDYLFFVDSDDFIEEDTIEYLYNLCEDNKVPLAICQSQVIYNYNYKTKNKKEKVEYITGIDLVKKILLNVERNGNIWGKLIKKDLLKNIRFEDRIISDVAVIHKLVIDIERIAYSNQVKYYYLKHKDSIVGSLKVDRDIDYYKAALERYDYIENKYPNLYENKICIMWSVVTLYSRNNVEINKYLEDVKAFELFKRYFSFKAIFSKLGFRDKIKIILFKINPKLFLHVLNRYLKIKHQ